MTGFLGLRETEKTVLFIDGANLYKAARALGFDMDYTLALYHQARLERLSIELTLSKLIEKRGYPEEIRHLNYEPQWAIRGLMVDRKLGNVFKLDRHSHVGRCYHGTRKLTPDERKQFYRAEKINFSDDRYEWIEGHWEVAPTYPTTAPPAAPIEKPIRPRRERGARSRARALSEAVSMRPMPRPCRSGATQQFKTWPSPAPLASTLYATNSPAAATTSQR